MNKREVETVREYKALVLKMGQGFHPDTPFHDYEPPITFMTENAFEVLREAIFCIEGFDPYEAGLELFALLEQVETP